MTNNYLYVEKGREDTHEPVMAFYVKEIQSYFQQFKVIPNELVPFVRKKFLSIATDHKDLVIVSVVAPGETQGALHPDDVLIIRSGDPLSTEKTQLSAMAGYQFENQFVHVNVPAIKAPEEEELVQQDKSKCHKPGCTRSASFTFLLHDCENPKNNGMVIGRCTDCLCGDLARDELSAPEVMSLMKEIR